MYQPAPGPYPPGMPPYPPFGYPGALPDRVPPCRPCSWRPLQPALCPPLAGSIGLLALHLPARPTCLSVTRLGPPPPGYYAPPGFPPHAGPPMPPMPHVAPPGLPPNAPPNVPRNIREEKARIKLSAAGLYDVPTQVWVGKISPVVRDVAVRRLLDVRPARRALFWITSLAGSHLHRSAVRLSRGRAWRPTGSLRRLASAPFRALKVPFAP